jgi:hypothetical protein
VQITIRALTGYVDTTGAAIQSAVAASIAGLAIGADILHSRLYGPALLPAPLGSTYNITALTLARSGETLSTLDLVLAFNEAANCAASNITIIVTS